MVIITTLESFKPLMVALISAMPPEVYYLFCFIFKLDRSSSRCFLLAVPTITVITPEIKEPKWEFCQLLTVLISILHPRTGEITTEWTQGPTEQFVKCNPYIEEIEY